MSKEPQRRDCRQGDQQAAKMMAMLTLTVSLLGALLPCSAERVMAGLEQDCVPSADFLPGFSFFPEEFQARNSFDTRSHCGVEIEFADDFVVEYCGSFKVVKNLRANETYVLYLCGTEPPSVMAVDDGAKLFEIPLSSVSVFDTSVIEFLQILGVADRAAYASEFSTDPCFQRIQGECGRVAIDPTDETADPDHIAEQDANVDAIFLFSATENNKTVAFTAVADPAVLKRAEWVKFASLFFNKEAEANVFFDKVRSAWESMLQDGLQSAAPVVAWVERREFPTDNFFIHFAPFKVEYIEAAGGRPLEEDELEELEGVEQAVDGFSIPFDDVMSGSQILLPILERVDVLIDETFAPVNSEYNLQFFLDNFGIEPGEEVRFPFLQENKLFRLDRTVSPGSFSEGLDWFETAVARPDLVLVDFLQAFDAPNAPANRERKWLRNVAEGELPRVVQPEDCVDFPGCDVLPEVICPSVVAACDGGVVLRGLTEACAPPDCD